MGICTQASCAVATYCTPAAATRSVARASASCASVRRLSHSASFASNASEAEGERLRATVSTHERTTLDMEAARKKLGAAWCRRHSTTETQTLVRVSARKRVD